MLPLPNLDDRRFDDLVAELQARLAHQLPDMAPLVPGDPVHALVDMFAWLAETVIYRANRIPERQRRAFLNLLQVPLRPARPARGVVSIDAVAADGRGALPPLLRSETALSAGDVAFSTLGELQPMPLMLRLQTKRTLDATALAAQGITLAQLRDQYGVEPAAFRPTTLVPGSDALTLRGTQDGAFHLALCLPKPLGPAAAERVRGQIAGQLLNIGLAPLDDADGDLATTVAARRLQWDLAWWPDPEGAPGTVRWLPLEAPADSSRGGRQTGVARLRLPREAALLRVPLAIDPQFAGLGDAPPEPPADIQPGQVVAWLRLRCLAEPQLTLGHIAVNAVDVVGQGVVRDEMPGVGTGQPDQVLALARRDVDAASLQLDVQAATGFEAWAAVPQFAGLGPDDAVYMLDAASGELRFGDGVRGRRPPANARVRAAAYRHGGGSRGNLPPGRMSALPGGRLKLRQEWPLRGGVDGETVAEAERRIPAFLGHRERAVTAEDFGLLARDNPLNPVARADALAGFFPGASLLAVRRNVPGVVSVFVLPPAPMAMAAAPRPSAGLLTDVHAWLAPRCLIGCELYVLAPQYLRIAVAVALEVIDPATEQTVITQVEQALLRYLWPLQGGGPRGEGWPRGRAVEINELRTQAGRVAGVEAVNGLRLFVEDSAVAAGTTRWRELPGSQALTLTDYQLPELMAVSVSPGEAQPAPPRGYAPGTPGTAGTPGAAGSGPQGVPVPVIPDLC